AESGGIQAVTHGIVIRQRHELADVLGPEPDRIDPGAIRIPDIGKEVEGIQIERSSASIGLKDIAVEIDRRRSRKSIPVPARGAAGRTRGQIAENAPPGGVRENRSSHGNFLNVPLIVNQGEEKGFVLLDRAANPAAELVAVLVI